MNSNPKIQSKLNEFECQRCQRCCVQPGFVYLRENEAEKIAEYLGKNLYDFTDAFCDVVDKRRLALKKRQNESCIFLNEDGCSIHEVKPRQCRDFPVLWRTENSFRYCDGLKKLGFTSEEIKSLLHPPT